MIKSLLIVGLGSFVGGALRYGISTLMKEYCSKGFPWGTLVVNLLGCFAIGMIFALFSKYSSPSSGWCLMLTTGVCGGFTTFSTFANESLQMAQNGNIASFVGYVATSLIVGLALTALGYLIVK